MSNKHQLAFEHLAKHREQLNKTLHADYEPFKSTLQMLEGGHDLSDADVAPLLLEVDALAKRVEAFSKWLRHWNPN